MPGTSTKLHNPEWNRSLLAPERAAYVAGEGGPVQIPCAGGCGSPVFGRGGSVYCGDCRGLCDELADASRVDYSRRERS